jgi:hypothetical protein
MTHLSKKANLIFIVFIVTITHFSCAKIKQDKIDGTWIRFNVANIDPEFNEYWIFKNNEVTVEKEEMVLLPGDTVETLQTVVIDKGVYEVSANMTKSFVKLSEFVIGEYYTVNKKWQIIDLDKEIFSLSSTVGPGAQYLEFYRE